MFPLIKWNLFVVSIIVIIAFEIKGIQGKLEPTKILNNGIYKLEIQSEDKFLTSTDNNTMLARRTRWANRLDQKWKFSTVQYKSTVIGEQEGWKIATIDGKYDIPLIWKIGYVGHGKYRFINFESGLCLAGIGSGAVGERNCEKDSPFQRWLVLQTNA